MVKIAVYGSLRKGEFNFKRVNAMCLETVTFYGYKLYSFGPYPAAVETYDGLSQNYPLVVDLLEVDEETFMKLYRMERGASYYMTSCSHNGETYLLWVMQPSLVGPAPQIKSGDWSTRHE